MTSIGPLLVMISSSAPDVPGRTGSVTFGLRLLVFVSLLGVVVLCSVAVLIALRRGRRMRRDAARERKTGDGRDPWVEAGKRAKPLPADPPDGDDAPADEEGS